MHLLRGAIRHYDWGDVDFIPSLLGESATGEPCAELWYGTHHGAPSEVFIDGAWIGLEKVSGDLDILVKVLASAHPLSLQTHPTREQAARGFARENDAGLPIDAPTRLYRDPHDKPEILIALTPFEALCGFRPIRQSVADLSSYSWHHEAAVLEVQGIKNYVHWCFDTDSMPPLKNCPQWLRDLASAYPNDKALRVAPLLHHVILQPMQAVALHAGNLHAYLKGAAVEVMSSSDNVIRSGFTSKHVDVVELLSVTDFDVIEEPVQTPLTNGVVSVYESPVDELLVERIEVDGTHHLPMSDRHRIVLCTEGSIGILTPGHAALVTPGQHEILEGHGTVFVCAGTR
jgi:mannose-6-phosphate isomerase